MKKNIEPKTNVFKTTDFYLSCFLYSKNFHIINTEKLNDNKVYFVFEDMPDRQELLNQYYNNNANVKVLDYVNSINALKSIIRNLNQ